MNDCKAQLDSMIEIRRLKIEAECYKSAFEHERIWRWVCLFMAFVMISRSIYDLWTQ